MIYITGDRRAYFKNISDFCYQFKTSIKDIMIILGDFNIDYYSKELDYKISQELNNIPITMLVVCNNMDEYLSHLKKSKSFHGGKVYYDSRYPNILFARDKEIYRFKNKKFLILNSNTFSYHDANIILSNKYLNIELDDINKKLNYDIWYIPYHTNFKKDRIRFIYDDIDRIM